MRRGGEAYGWEDEDFNLPSGEMTIGDAQKAERNAHQLLRIPPYKIMETMEGFPKTPSFCSSRCVDNELH